MSKFLLTCMIGLFMSLVASAEDEKLDNPTAMTAAEASGTYKAVNAHRRVSVHDPSIVKDAAAKKYYVFGSHLASGVSTDMKNWSGSGWTYGIVNANGTISTTDYKHAFLTNQTKTVKILQGTDTIDAQFGNFDCLQWRYTANNADLSGNQWAPDVIWNPHMNKWCMYMSLNGDDWRSVIVLLTSAAINGPYVYQGPVTFSGFQWTDLPDQTWEQTDIKLVPGLSTVKSLPSRYLVGRGWGNRWPNNIDPCVFFDDKGQMWMAYGSWSGGIFLLKLDAKTGLRDYTVKYGTSGSGDDYSSDAYFGKKIAGGRYVSGEGSYIEKIGDHYHLFMSYGGLNSDGGYEMRTYRSSMANGAYKDAKGTDAVFKSYQLNYGPNASSNAGNRLFGSFRWETMADAEVAQGHNSAFVDDDGRAYLIYHTRFANGGEGHQVRVHQLFLNQQGWLVAAPYEFMGCPYNQDSIDSRQICSLDDIEGTYKVMLHPYKINHSQKAYQSDDAVCYLHKDGTVTGDYTGSWLIPAEGKSYIQLKLKKGSEASVTYNGVILPQTIDGTNIPTVCFTALSNNGVVIWGSNADGRYAVSYAYGKYKLPFTAQQLITKELNLKPITTYFGTTINFVSSRPELIDDHGNLQVTPVGNTDNDTIVRVDMNCRYQKDNYRYDLKRTVRIRMDKNELALVTGIDAPHAHQRTTGNAVYDLRGRRITNGPPLHGIYIINGKKVLMK